MTTTTTTSSSSTTTCNNEAPQLLVSWKNQPHLVSWIVLIVLGVFLLIGPSSVPTFQQHPNSMTCSNNSNDESFTLSLVATMVIESIVVPLYTWLAFLYIGIRLIRHCWWLWNEKPQKQQSIQFPSLSSSTTCFKSKPSNDTTTASSSSSSFPSNEEENNNNLQLLLTRATQQQQQQQQHLDNSSCASSEKCHQVNDGQDRDQNLQNGYSHDGIIEHDNTQLLLQQAQQNQEERLIVDNSSLMTNDDNINKVVAVVNLTGVYRLISNSNYEEFLAVQGVSWPLRRAANQARPIHRITHNGNILTIKIEGIIESQTTYILHGPPVETNVRGRLFRDCASYTPDGRGIQVCKTALVENYDVTITRRLSDDEQQIILTGCATFRDGITPPVQAIQIFQRISSCE